jgi:hypothetical protein
MKESAMTSEEQITMMKKAITQAMKVMGDRFGSTEADVEKALAELKASMQTSTPTAPQPSQGTIAVTAGA